MKTLGDVSVGETVKTVRIHGEGALRRRIMDLGITRGIELTVRRVAPLGDPMQISVRGSEISIRKSDAELVEVE